MAFAAGTVPCDRIAPVALTAPSFLPSLISYTEHIKYPEPEHNAVNPNEKTTQLARKSPVPPTQDQPQHPKSSSSEAHGASRSAKW